MTRAGPWHAQRLRRGDAFVDGLREELLARLDVAPGSPVTHSPNARMLVLRRKQQPQPQSQPHPTECL
jgi:hypothetical protein